MDADVVVVGAGLAGLRCARALQDAGRTVQVVEAASQVGGRVSTELVDGFRCDRGFQVLNPAYPAVQEWVDVDALELGSFDAGVMVRAVDGLRIVADPVRAPQHLAATLRSGLLDPADLWALGRWMAPAMVAPQRSMGPMDLPLRDALDAAGAHGRLRHVLDRFIAGVLVDSHGTTSAAFTRLLLRVFALGRPGLPAGGMRELPAQLADGLPVRLDSPVEEVRRLGEGAGMAVLVAGQTLRARAVVVATDVTTASRLTTLPSHPVKGLVTWWFAADEAPTPHALLAVEGRGHDAPVGPVWNTAVVTHAQPSYAPPDRHLVQATTLLDRPDGDAPETVVRAHLADLYGCDASRWELVVRHRIPDALPAMPPPLDARRPVELSPGLYVCGDHRDTASIQGALVSGQRTPPSDKDLTARRRFRISSAT